MAPAGAAPSVTIGAAGCQELLQDDHGGGLVDHRALLAAVDAALTQMTGR